MKPSNTPGRPAPRTRAPSGSCEAPSSRGPCEPHTPDCGRGAQRLPAPQRGCSGGGDGWEDGAVRRGAKSLPWKPALWRSAPGDACSVHGSRAPSGRLGFWAKGRGPWVSPRHQQVARGCSSGRQEPSRPGAAAGVARRCRAQGLTPARWGARRASGHTATTLVRRRPSRRSARGLQPRTRSPGRAPLFRSVTRSIAPGRGKARARSPHPRGSAVTLKSQLLSKWGQHKGAGQGAERDVLSAPRAGDTPPRHQTHQRARRRGRPDAFQAPTSRSEPSGPAGHTGLAPSWRVARPAGRRSRTSKVTAVLYPLRKRRGERGGSDARRRPLRSPERAAQLVPRATEPNAESPNWRTQRYCRCGTESPRGPGPGGWRARRGRAGGGGGRGAARGDRLQRQLLLRRPWPPLSPRACRPPPPAGCQAHSSPARRLVRAHPERVGAPGE